MLCICHFVCGLQKKLKAVDEPFTMILPLRSSCALRVFEDQEELEPMAIPRSWCARIGHNVRYGESANAHDDEAGLYRIVVTFAADSSQVSFHSRNRLLRSTQPSTRT